MKKLRGIVWLAAMGVGLVMSPALYAGLTVSPARSEYNVATGTLFSAYYDVTNPDASTVTVKISKRDWVTLPENKNISVKDWLTFPFSELVLGPKQTKSMVFDVKVPTDLAGVTAAMVSFTPVTASTESAQIQTVLSVPLYVTARGTEKINWDIETLSISKAALGLDAYVLIASSSNIIIRPSGLLRITGGWGKKVCEEKLKEDAPVYPYRSRQFALPVGNCKLKNGKYKVELFLEDARGNRRQAQRKFKISKKGVEVIP